MNQKQQNVFSNIYISINHGIFLCKNCARVHQDNYGVEVSYIKTIINPKQANKSDDTDMETSIKSNKVANQLKLSQWTYTQLRVLIISGGNRAFVNYMDQYDLMTETQQKKYSTIAAQYYRDHLKNKVSGGNQKGMML